MTFAAVLVLAAAGLEPRLESCPDAWLDVRQVRAQLALNHALPDGEVRVRCEAGGRVQLTHRGARRDLTLTGATAAQRERTLSLFIAAWLEPSRLVSAPVSAGGRPDAGAQVGPSPLPLSPPPQGEGELVRAPEAARSVAQVGPSPLPLSPLPQGEGAPEAAPPVAEAEVDAGLPVLPPEPPPPTETLVPIEFGLVPGVGLNLLFPAPTRNYFALGLIGVTSRRVDGASLGLISLVDERLRGFQFGAATSAGETQGLQVGTLYASSTASLTGAQWSAGFTRTTGTLTGLQFALVNVAGRLDGVQLGTVSLADATRGLQLGVVFASSSSLVGAQLGLGLNRTGGDLAGLQVGTLNIAGDVSGAQFGLINVAEDLTGFQLGIVNIARSVVGTQVGVLNVSSDGPAPLGAINLTDDAPVRVALTLGDTHLAGVQLKTGGTVLYGIVSLGWVPRAQVRAGGGVGLHLGAVTKPGWFGQLELTSHATLNLEALARGPIATLGLGLNAGYRLAPRLSMILGPQLSLIFGNPGFPGASVSLLGLPLNASGLAFAPGLQGGVEF